MKTNKPIQIFKPGTHTAMSGAVLAFSESDLAACAAAYDPAKHEAPLVVGHPKHDAPAYGWVKQLAFADGALIVIVLTFPKSLHCRKFTPLKIFSASLRGRW